MRNFVKIFFHISLTFSRNFANSLAEINFAKWSKKILSIQINAEIRKFYKQNAEIAKFSAKTNIPISMETLICSNVNNSF